MSDSKQPVALSISGSHSELESLETYLQDELNRLGKSEEIDVQIFGPEAARTTRSALSSPEVYTLIVSVASGIAANLAYDTAKGIVSSGIKSLKLNSKPKELAKK